MIATFVIPAKAGIQPAAEPGSAAVWTPAFAGVTGGIGRVPRGDKRCAC